MFISLIRSQTQSIWENWWFLWVTIWQSAHTFELCACGIITRIHLFHLFTPLLPFAFIWSRFQGYFQFSRMNQHVFQQADIQISHFYSSKKWIMLFAYAIVNLLNLPLNFTASLKRSSHNVFLPVAQYVTHGVGKKRKFYDKCIQWARASVNA